MHSSHHNSDKHSPKRSPEKIVEGVERNLYIAPIVTIAIILSSVLTYIVTFTDALEKVENYLSRHKHEQATRQDHELASFYLGQAIADREIYIENKYVKDEAANNQNLAEIGTQLKALNIEMDYKSLDCRPDYIPSMGLTGSSGGTLIKNGVVGLHDEQLLDYYTIGRQTEILRRFSDSNPEYQQSTAIGALRLLDEVMIKETLDNSHLHQELEKYDDTQSWNTYLAKDIRMYAVQLNISVVQRLGGSIGFHIKTNFPEQMEPNTPVPVPQSGPAQSQ
jgi:hypothetical protein